MNERADRGQGAAGLSETAMNGTPLWYHFAKKMGGVRPQRTSGTVAGHLAIVGDASPRAVCVVREGGV